MHEKICIGAFSKKIKEGLKMKLNLFNNVYDAEYKTIDNKVFIESLAKATKLFKDAPTVATFNSGGVNLMVSDDKATFEDDIEIKHLRGDKGIKVGFNSNYFIECLKVFEDSQVAISISWKSLPIEFTHSNTTCILMPIRINKEVK